MSGNRVVVPIDRSAWRTKEEQKAAEKVAVTDAVIAPGPLSPARDLPADQVTGYETLPVPPEKSATDVPIDRLDQLGHRIRNGVCQNEGCALAVFVPARKHGATLTADATYFGWTIPCPGIPPPSSAFVPRVVKWCQTCLKPFEGEKCGECK